MSNRVLCCSWIAAVVVTGLVAAPTLAVEGILLEAVDSGAYNWLGDHTATNENYSAGNVDPPTWLEARNFFVFDLSAVTGTILAAALELYNPGDPPDLADGYRSPDESEVYAVYDVTTLVDVLVAGGTGMTAIFDDLGSGVELGSVLVSAADNGRIVRVNLEPEAVAELNAASGLWAVGGALETIGGGGEEVVFGYTGAPEFIRRLRLGIEIFSDGFELGNTENWSETVPEP